MVCGASSSRPSGTWEKADRLKPRAPSGDWSTTQASGRRPGAHSQASRGGTAGAQFRCCGRLVGVAAPQASIGSDLPLAIENYALIGDCHNGSARRSQWLHRLAVLATLRQQRVLRSPARHVPTWAMADLPRRPDATCQPRLSRRHSWMPSTKHAKVLLLPLSQPGRSNRL
jgi:hypothetical protein